MNRPEAADERRPFLVWSFLVLTSMLISACDIGPLIQSSPTPLLGEPVRRVDGSRALIGVLEPPVDSMSVGQVTGFTFTTNTGAVPSEVTWVNETPAVVSVHTPVDGCGTRCAMVLALAPGEAQLRPFAIVNGARIEAPRRISVR